MKSALIWGVSGQDGAALASLLLTKGYRVVGITTDDAATPPENLRRLGIDRHVALASVPLPDRERLLALLTGQRPDEIYDLSPLGETPAVTTHLLEALHASCLPARLLTACSSECFGETPREGADEETAFRPRSERGIASASAFWQVRNLREAHGRFACSAILFDHASPLEDGRALLPRIVQAAHRIARGEAATLALGSLELVRDWGWTEEYVEALWRMLQQERPRDLVIASGSACSLGELVTAVFSALGLDWERHVTVDPTRDGPLAVRCRRGRPALAEAVLGWRATAGGRKVVARLVAAETGERPEAMAPAPRSIPVYVPYLCGNERAYVNECLDSTWISSRGGFIERFEEAFARYVGAQHATSVCNGTTALHLALTALGLGPGDEVIVPALTYIASVNTIAQTGATPVFADCLERSFQVDPDSIRRRITPRTRAIMAVHLYGHPCDMDAIGALCREHDLWLVEDCAEALGSLYRGRHVGTFGDVATFSFFGNKTITTGEGGMVVARTRALHERCYRLKTQGVSPEREYWHDTMGFNYRMTNVQAALGLAQLEQIDEILVRKRRLATWYREGLAGLPLRFHDAGEKVTHSYWMCCIVVADGATRDALRNWLASHQIETRPFFHPAHVMPVYRSDAALPISERLGQCGLNLPSSPALSAADADRICGAIHAFFRRGGPAGRAGRDAA